MERNKHRGPGGASCFIWQIEAPYPHGPVITQESRVNKEKSRPLLPLFLLSITFSHSPSVRYNPLLFSLCGPHCLLSFLPPPPRFVPSTVCSPEGIFQGSSNSLAVALRRSCSLFGVRIQFYCWCEFRLWKILNCSALKEKHWKIWVWCVKRRPGCQCKE